MRSPDTMVPKAPRPASLGAAVPGLRRLARHVRPYLRSERRLVAGGFLALFLEVAMRLLEPWPLKFVIDGVIGATGASADVVGDTRTVLLLAALALLAVVGLRAACAYAMTVCFALAGNRLLTRVTSDVGRLKEVSVTAGLPLVGNVLTMVGMVVVAAVLDWQLALVMLTVVPAFLLIGARRGRRIHVVSRGQRKADGALASLATETLSSMQVVHTYSLETRLQQAFASSNQRSLQNGVKATRLSAGLERRTDVLVGLATALVLYVGANRVISGALTPGELVVFLTYLKATFKPMRDLAKYTGRIAQAAASGERIVDVLEERPTVVDHRQARPLSRVRGDIRFERVTLAYEQGHPVLRELDLHIRPGQRVAIVGPSGAGKSSLAMLLSRLRDPDEGRVLVDGHDVTDVTLSSLRSQIAIVLQESLLFATSIRENIAYGRPGASDQDIVRAAELAGADEFIRRLPDGYDTVVGERGATLSGGQRQRVAIARAALRDAPIVILDEAMSGLDEDTEREVVHALNRLTSGRTTLVITHDLDAARDCDRVVWIEGGGVARSGPPDDVLAHTGPGVQRGSHAAW
jgi:ATP-binding cassette subfamily B protein